MKRLGILSLVVLIHSGLIVSSGFGQHLTGASLFSDHKARSVGDVITILVVEESVAASKANTTTDKSTDLNLEARGGGSADLFKPLFGMRGGLDNSFSGEGKTERKGTLKARISATVVSVRSNGDLEIQGSREVVVNGEREMTTITGVVRPADVSTLNTVYSYNVAEAKISYVGKGDINNGQRPGLIARFFNWIF